VFSAVPLRSPPGCLRGQIVVVHEQQAFTWETVGFSAIGERGHPVGIKRRMSARGTVMP
jgi:hypothetical protein